MRLGKRLEGLLAGLALAAASLLAPAAAAETVQSRCLAIAEAMPTTLAVSYLPVAEGMQQGLETPAAEAVAIRFIGHATFLITSPQGVTIATDYNGFVGRDVVPRVVTMNHAHRTHYTDTPDPRIEYVLRGWDPAGGRAVHDVQVGDVRIRNVTTDIRRPGGREAGGNSIFIFETAQLCIGHLGHLHHVLTPEDLGAIGQLDIVMVPVDGSYTMDQGAMLETLKVLRARLVLPMHYFGAATLSRFMARLGDAFDVAFSAGPEISVSARTLPERPKVLVLPGF